MIFLDAIAMTQAAASKSTDPISELRRVFSGYVGQTADEIAKTLRLQVKKSAKNYYARITERIISGDESLVQSGVGQLMVKTIRVRKDGVPAEDVSLPPFEYIEFMSEKWGTSRLRSQLSTSIVFVIFSLDSDTTPVLSCVKPWKMPKKDLDGEVKRVWSEAQKRIEGKDYENLPKKRDSKICHIRPHGRNKRDVRLTPHSRLEVKRSFFLNSAYISEQLSRC
jgi:DNA mismatch repair protein MutH